MSITIDKKKMEIVSVQMVADDNEKKTPPQLAYKRLAERHLWRFSFKAPASLHSRIRGFLLLIEVNFLGYQFSGHVGKIDSPRASPECWDVEGDGQEDREMTLFPHHPRTRLSLLSSPNQITNIGGQPWLEEISIRLIRPASQRQSGQGKYEIINIGGVGVVRGMGVGRGIRDEMCVYVCWMCVRMGKSNGQWVISASSRFSKAQRGQPGGGSPLAPWCGGPYGGAHI